MLVMVLVMGVVFCWTSKQVQSAMLKKEGMRTINALMTARMVDHYQWMDGLSSGLFVQKKKFTGKLDPAECNLGKWMVGWKPYCDEITSPFEALDEPHRKLHASAE